MHEETEGKKDGKEKRNRNKIVGCKILFRERMILRRGYNDNLKKDSVVDTGKGVTLTSRARSLTPDWIFSPP